MIARLVVLAFVVALSTAAAGRLLAQNPNSPTLVLTGVTVIDTIAGRAVANRTVTIAGGTILAVTAAAEPARGARILDARGMFLIPGLWDMHAHHELTGEASLPLYVVNGVTGTRDMGSNLDLVLRLRQLAASGGVVSPRIVAAGPILDNFPGVPLRLQIQTADEGRNAVRMLKARSVDFVKVHDRTPREAYFAIAEEARQQNLPIAGHVPRGVTFEEAVQAGQRNIEHLSGMRVYTQCSGGQGYSREGCKTFFEWLAREGVWQTPTLLSWRNMFTIGTPASNPDNDHYPYASPSLKSFLALNQRLSNVSAEGVRGLVAASDTAAVALSDMQTAGVGVLTGCDGMVPGFCVHDELVLFVRGGMSPAAALQAATINPARYLGLHASLGSVEAGKAADLVLLDANPLDDIANVRRIRAVILRGTLLEREELDTTLDRLRTQFR